MAGNKVRIWFDTKRKQVLPQIGLWPKLKGYIKSHIIPKFSSKEKSIINCRQLGAISNAILCNIETQGYANKYGLSGLYVLLQYDNWSFGDEYENIEVSIAKSKTYSKNLLLLPITIDGTQILNISDPIEMHFPPGIMGIRFLNWSVNSKTIELLDSHYKIWKIRNQR